ncbi:MAG: hypothetical protein ABI550_01865, partial [Ignavibacteriaceae bacterium]
MAKAKRNIKTSKRQKESELNRFNFDKIIPPKFHTLAAIIFIVVLFLIYFSPMYFGNKTFQSGDIITSMSYENFLASEDYPLWNPMVFCGFPSAATLSPFRWFDFISAIYSKAKGLFTSFFSVTYAGYSFYLLILAITSFIFMRSLKAGTGISLFVSLSTVFSTGIIVFLMIGHVSKLAALSMYPLIFMTLLKFQKDIKILDVLLLIIAIHLTIVSLHMQIIFYMLFSVGIYFAYFLIRSFIKKEKELTKKILKSLGIFSAAVIIAGAMQFDEISQLYEYTPYSTRGSESIVEKSATPSENSESAFYDYHTSWSFSPGEVLTFIFPSFYGFGNSTYKGPLTQGREAEVQTYFGQMPFVDVAMYMGVIIFFLALYAMIFRRKDPFVQFLTILVVISLLISFGRTFSILFDPMFYYFPMFNKFRVPSMILVLVQLSMPVLAGLGLMRILSLKNDTNEKELKIIKNIAFSFAGLFVISLLLSSAVSSWFVGRVGESADKGQRLLQMQLGDYMSEIFIGDVLVSFALAAAVFGLLYFYLVNKLSKDLLIAAILVLGIFDLWRIDQRATKYIDSPAVTNSFNTPDYISAIKNQNDKEPHRLLNIKQDGSLGSFSQNSNYHAYFLEEDLYGYSGIKPRAYQDIID